MADPRFFSNHGPFDLSAVLEWTGANASAHDSRSFKDVAPLDRAGESDISFFDNPKYLEQFMSSQAGACFVKEKYASKAPEGMVTLITPDPYRSYAMVAQRFYPHLPVNDGISDQAYIDPSAQIGEGSYIGPGTFIGKNVQIGKETVIGANVVIHDGVMIGDDCRIGGNSTISHAIIGDKAIIHRGVHIGQDGFGFAMGRDGHVKVPQLGRVVIGDDVEIGAGTCVDRGSASMTWKVPPPASSLAVRLGLQGI